MLAPFALYSQPERPGRVNIENKLKQCVDLVNKAVDYMGKNTIEQACRSFSQEESWRIGEINVFVLDNTGILLVDGDDVSMIWKSLVKQKGSAGKKLFDIILDKSVEGDWVNYEWNNAWKQSYIKKVEKGDTFYIVGAGFYPESQEHTVTQLVRGAVNSFYDQGAEATWASIDNPFGPFIRGDIFLFAYKFDGTCVAHGQNPAFIGQEAMDAQDDYGKFYVQEMIKIARSPEGAGWLEYEWRSAHKRAYVEQVMHPQTKQQYVIGAGYYPNINEDAVKRLVNKAERFLKSAGTREAITEFSSTNPKSGYNYGPLGLFMYSLDGEVLVDTENPGFVGQNLINRKDPSGRQITRSIIDQAVKYGNGWVTFEFKNAYNLTYVQLVNMPEGKFVIGAGYYPASKEQTVATMVQRAAQYLEENDRYKAFGKFSNPAGEFYRGDVYIFAYTPKGTSLVNGSNKTVVWTNFIDAVDDTGKTVVDDIVALARAGGGWLTYSIRNAQRRVLVKTVVKNVRRIRGRQRREVIIIGSGYFL